MPYFLYSGQHVTVDIPALWTECRQRFPQITIELLPTLENDPALEDLVVERLTPCWPMRDGWPTEGSGHRAAKLRDHRPATGRLGPGRSRAHGRSFAAWSTPRPTSPSPARCAIHPQAVERGRAALAAGKPVLCDVKMLQAGMTKIRGEILCADRSRRGGRLARPEGMHAGGGRHGTARAAAGRSDRGDRQRADRAVEGHGDGPRRRPSSGLGRRAARGIRRRPGIETGLCWKAIFVTSPTPARGRQFGGGGGRQRAGHARARRNKMMWKAMDYPLVCDLRRCASCSGPRRPMPCTSRKAFCRSSWAGLWFLVAAPFSVLGTVDHRSPPGREDPRAMALVAMVGAAIFVISVHARAHSL